LIERWRRPAVVLDVQQDPEQVYETRSGRTFGNVRLLVDRETYERMRLGYMCANCQEPFQIPWPRVCNFCGVYVREQQADFLAKQYRGEETLKGGFNYDEEIERIREAADRKQREEK
jgi:hypothetical protein